MEVYDFERVLEFKTLTSTIFDKKDKEQENCPYLAKKNHQYFV